MIDDQLNLYLSTTRTGRRGILNSRSVAYYAPIIGFLRATINVPENIHPKVGLVYTLSRRSELVNMCGTPVLIHDQHLGQTLATCLRILAMDPDFKAKLRFFMRILAEESLSIGDAAGAATGYLNAYKYNKDWSRVPKSDTKFEVVIESKLQEMFIFSHEYCHLLMSYSPEFHASRLRVGDMLLEAKREKVDPVKAYAELKARYPDEQDFESFKINIERQRQLYIDQADDLRVEVSCDDFALHALLHHSKETGLPSRHTFRAAFLALRHMRAIHYIRACVSSVKAKPNIGDARAIRILQGREHALRGVMALAAKASGISGQLEGVWSDLADLSDRQDELIDLPLLNKIIPAFAKARNATARKKRWSFNDTLVIARQQDWDTQSDTIEHIAL